jgi:hypothetical protein
MFRLQFAAVSSVTGSSSSRMELVGIETRYGLDGPGMNPDRREIFRTGPGAHPASCTMGTGSLPGVKRPGRGVDHPPRSTAEVKQEWSCKSTAPLGPRGLF